VALVQRLANIQHTQGLTDGDMAKLLKVSRSLWAGTRRGEIPLGDSIRKGAARLRGSYPELQEAVLASLEAED
jgi:hypothetical protein